MEPVSISFTQEELKVLNEALVELPFRKAAPLISSINAQIQRQYESSYDAAVNSDSEQR